MYTKCITNLILDLALTNLLQVVCHIYAVFQIWIRIFGGKVQVMKY
jgi:uncharacterized damage-inducible protein DinB